MILYPLYGSNIKILTKIVLLLAVLFLFSCDFETPGSEAQISYSFFVAGHVYGNKQLGTRGFHPPFKKKLPMIKEHDSIKFGVLAGDIVFKNDESSWDIIDREVNALGMPVFFVPGNHDLHESDLFRRRYADKTTGETYFSFYEKGDLFIFLDANIDSWNISGKQLEFLKKTLSNNTAENNIFIFVHQLIWWDKNNEFANIVPNQVISSIPDSLNYWSDVEPLLSKLPNKVFLFAGDLGAEKKTTPYLYFQKNNISYIASGMGSEENDNFILTNVLSDGRVEFQLVALQGEMNRFGNLVDFVLP